MTTSCSALLLLLATSPVIQNPGPQQPVAASTAPAQTTKEVACASKPGERTHCAADTSAGVVLLRLSGDAPCLLGKSWGYDQAGVWVSDGCSATFGTGVAEPQTTKPKPLTHIPNVGFLLFDGDKGRSISGFSATRGI